MSKIREQLLAGFEKEYKKLNENQKKAVDQTEGPVMVIAGPGTGKTQILAIRIGKILLATDTLPQNILCLTYTEAGAIAMRERLVKFIGTDAYKVNISTFHSFCNQIIQENLSVFQKNELNPIDELERVQLLKTLIDDLPAGHLLKRLKGDVYYDSFALARLFSDMKRENWSISFLHEKIDEYLKSLPEREEFIYKRKSGPNKAGDLKMNKINEETERMEKLKAAVSLFENYQSLMNKNGFYDFDDMINWVIKAFDNQPELLADYQEKYQYILVDEYQDTSGSQNYLVFQLINYWDQPNVFVVGDDDQSIFRFQGANVKNMEDFHKKYEKDIQTIVLTNNYRSTQPILDISSSLIELNTERLINKRPGLKKDLIASHPEINKLKNLPEIFEYDSERHELIGITKKVVSLIEKGTEPSEIAVIFKENKYLVELLNLFRLKDIPAYCKRSVNLFDIPFCNSLIDIIRYLAEEHDTPFGGDEILFRMLHFNFFNIEPIEIATITSELKYVSGKKESLREAISLLAANKETKNTVSENLINASIAIEKLIGEVPNQTMQGLIDLIVRETGMLKMIMNSSDKIWLLQVLTAFYNFVKAETAKKPLTTPMELVATIDLMKSNNIPIPLIQVTGNKKGVNLLTAHGSKGLEYEHVFIGGLYKTKWEEQSARNSGFKFPDTVISSLAEGSKEEEIRRLFYVALTRAKKNLYISYPLANDAGKALEKSSFITAITESNAKIVPKYLSFTDETIAEFNALHFEYDARPQIAIIEKDFVTRLLEKFVMNVTALNNFLECPLKFYYNNLIRIPSAKNEYTEFGSAVHHALWRLFVKLETAGGFPSKEEFIEDFKWYMYRHRESFIQQVFERRMEYGETILGEYYEARIKGMHKKAKVEETIEAVIFDDILLKGKLDKIEFYDKNIITVDYKTGSYDNALKKLKQPNEKLPLGGDYWRQAVFYKILLDNSVKYKTYNAQSIVFDFIEPADKSNEYKKAEVVVSNDDIEIVKQQIKLSWEKIQNHEFYTGCGNPDCNYCNFVKLNKVYTSLHGPEEEEESSIVETW